MDKVWYSWTADCISFCLLTLLDQS